MGLITRFGPVLAFRTQSYSTQPMKYDLSGSQNVIVEFSSPNIAKPFHVGHLRSTIIGNFIANLLKYRQHNVTTLNYLGDWGTQFGFLQLGVDLKGYSDQEMERNPIENLFNAYIAANRAAENDPSISEKARTIFHQMENGQFEELQKWNDYRKYTVDELRNVYSRLGVQFDNYDWESMYKRKQIDAVLAQMKERHLLDVDKEGRTVVTVKDKPVPVVKSDGTTLYLTRDIAAISDRATRFRFDKMFYIVDNSQTNHFSSLFSVANRLNPKWDKQSLVHIKFGRIRGMSTRKGTCVFLRDILDEARDIMKQKQIESPTTKVDIVNMDDGVADALGISAVIVNDLKQRRQRDYDFDWERALQVTGDSGIKLQYTHCRLNSLMGKQGEPIANATDDMVLRYNSFGRLQEEADARHLVGEIDRFQAVIESAAVTLEACILVNYLFGLCNGTSKALKRLPVKLETCDERRREKLMLFKKAQLVLRQGMLILGLRPLEKM